MFLINSCSGLVSAAVISSGSKFHHQQQRTFSRSYGTILPSSFQQSSLKRLGLLDLTTCVGFGYDSCVTGSLETFPWKHGISHFAVQVQLAIGSQYRVPRICLRYIPTSFHLDNQRQADLTFSVLSSHYTEVLEY